MEQTKMYEKIKKMGMREFSDWVGKYLKTDHCLSDKQMDKATRKIANWYGNEFLSNALSRAVVAIMTDTHFDELEWLGFCDNEMDKFITKDIFDCLDKKSFAYAILDSEINFIDYTQIGRNTIDRLIKDEILTEEMIDRYTEGDWTAEEE
jgi:hypothetical protein